ncbi:MAG: thiamine biosynthesis protein ThiS [Sulfurovum sp.]|nr:MAG: thiamine biosynthesis protein ThiS [Sulfurovum sp.]
MQVSINGEPKTLPDGCSVKEMLQLLRFDDEWLGVAVNMEFVSKEKFEETILKEGDMVDVLAPMSGG